MSAQGQKPTRGLPNECAAGNDPCVPPDDFVQRLCEEKYPSVALVMFAKSAPWEHAYVRVEEVDAINSMGGPMADTRLVFAEEVLILRRNVNAATGGLQVSGPDSYDVLRLDGTCALLQEGEFGSYMIPRQIKYAPVVWKLLDPAIQEALSQSPGIEAKSKNQRTACRGVSMGGGSRECQRATHELARTIMGELRKGMQLPFPKRLPAWPRARLKAPLSPAPGRGHFRPSCPTALSSRSAGRSPTTRPPST